MTDVNVISEWLEKNFSELAMINFLRLTIPVYHMEHDVFIQNQKVFNYLKL